MTARRPPALRAALRAYRAVPVRDRAQVHLRRWSLPLHLLEAMVPPRGRILDVGCGRGLIASYLAIAAPGRDVTGIDIDPDKIGVAEAAAVAVATAGGSVEYKGSDGSELPPGPFAAVIFAEMLSLLALPRREALIEQAAALLGPGGVIVVKEVDSQPRWKHLVNLATSYVDLRVLRNLSGEVVLNTRPDYYVELLRSLGLDVEVTPLDRWYPFAHFVVTGRRPLAASSTASGLG